jgi:glycosyltransferase involved in cell wall biosynthesis
MPEPVEPISDISQIEARKELGLPAGARIIALLGHLDGRKGVLELLDAYRRIASRDTVLLLMGTVDPRIKDQVETIASNVSGVILQQGYLSSARFQHALIASDWQAVPYIRHIGSSGILARAAAYERPVIASNWGWVGEATRRFDLGVQCDPLVPSSICDAVRVACETSARATSTKARPFREFNTEQRFVDEWKKALRREVSDDGR